MAYPQYGQMEPGGDTGLLPTPGDASYQPTGAAAYPPPLAYEQQQQQQGDQISSACIGKKKGLCLILNRVSRLIFRSIVWLGIIVLCMYMHTDSSKYVFVVLYPY